MKSRIDANIYVIGDACIPGDMPKSAFSANSQAKVAAMSIRGELTNARVFPARYSNTCWSLIETDDNVFVGGTYEPGEGRIKQVMTAVSQKGEAPGVRKQNYAASIDWYNGITSEIFG
jgi:NADH dehydrogenase FAD-containing subunit